MSGGIEGITGEQLQAARALLRWSQQELAEKAGISVPTLKRLEGMRGRVKGMYETVLGVSGALSRAGIEFLNGDAPGVRLRPQAHKANGDGEDVAEVALVAIPGRGQAGAVHA